MYGQKPDVSVMKLPPLDRRLEMRTSQHDVAHWQAAATKAGYRSMTEWIRHTLNKEIEGGVRQAVLNRPAIATTRLENGIRVVSESIPGSKRIELGAFVECGWRDEGEERPGLAELCQRLLLAGTSSRDERQIATETYPTAGFVARDYTCFHASVPGEGCWEVMDLLGDVFLNSTFPQECLERERRSLLLEWNESCDEPRRYLEHLRRGTLQARRNALRRFDRTDVIYFVQRHYTPGRIVLAAAGDVFHEDLVAQARDAFWRLEGEDTPAAGAAPKRPPLWTEEEPFTHSYFCLEVAANASGADRWGLYALAEILGERLHWCLYRDLDLVATVNCACEIGKGTARVVVRGSALPENEFAAVQEILSAWRELVTWSSAATPAEIERAKRRLRTRNSWQGDHTYNRFQRIGLDELYFGKTMPEERMLAEIDLVNAGMLRQIARRLGNERLGNERLEMNLAVVGPVERGASAGLLEKAAAAPRALGLAI